MLLLYIVLKIMAQFVLQYSRKCHIREDLDRSRVNKQVHTVQRERERAQSLDQDNMLAAGIEPDAQAYWEKHLVEIAEKAQVRSFHVTCVHPF